MNRIFFLIISIYLFSSCTNQSTNPPLDRAYNNVEKDMDLEMDLLDGYNLKFGNAYLFSQYEDFIKEVGLPGKAAITNAEFIINSKADLDKVISGAKDIVRLHYPGIEMWFTYDNFVIPSTIDFRKTELSVTYEETTFNQHYTIKQFKEQFPISANPSFTLPQSFFETVTGEKGPDYKHFVLYRKSKDDPRATPLIEFTFRNERLIYILFDNVS